MTPTKFNFLLGSLIFMSVTIVSAQSNVKADEKTIAHLKKFRSDYIKSMLDKKPEKIQAYYSENIRLMPAFQKTVLGKSNAASYHKAFLTRFDINDFKRNEIEILDLGTQVLEIGKLTMRIRLKTTGKEYELTGTYLNIWEELKNGELSIITEAWNYDRHYAEFHEYLRFEEVVAVHAALQPNVPVNSNISFELAALNRLLDATVTQHNANVWSQYYTDDAMLVPSYYPLCRGRKAVNEYIETHVKELPVFEELDIRNDRIDNLGNYIIEYASHIASWKNGESSGVSLGKNIRIWRREPDHSLKLFRSMGMYD
jgi:ketosteroid isomerase-like protein